MLSKTNNSEKAILTAEKPRTPSVISLHELGSGKDKKEKSTDVNPLKTERELGKTKRLFIWVWRHPFTRLSTALLIMTLNFLIYAIDPVVESRRDVNLPIIGSFWSILVLRWGSPYAALRVFICLIAFIGGPVIGWYFVHRKFLKGYLKLRMFGYYTDEEKKRIEEDDLDEYKGSWFTMTVTTIFWGYVWILLYSAIAPNEVDDWLGFSEYVFGQITISLSWFGDLFTFFMILDSMLQSTKVEGEYPWLDHSRDEWLAWGGYFRIVVFWVCFLFGSIIVIVMVWIRNDSMFETWRLDANITTFETARAFIAALIFALDLCTVTQDWDFPSFRNNEKIKIAGFNFFEVSFPPDWIKEKLPEFPDSLTFKINGKWMNYTPMVLVMGLDMAAFIAIAFYKPGEFAQYIGPDKKIWSVSNYTEANQLGLQFDSSQTYDLLNYTARAGQCINVIEDWCTNSTICNWNDNPAYCTFGSDVKLAGSFENNTTLWWTCIPIFLALIELVWSLMFLRQKLPAAPTRPSSESGNEPSRRSTLPSI